MKLMINIPDLRNKGGVAQYYKVLNLNEEPGIQYFSINNYGKNIFIRLIKTFISFSGKISKFDAICINPSLDKKSFYRDAVFAFLARIRRKKLIVFWHGWENEFESKIHNSKKLQLIFKNSFGKAQGVIVLSKIFKEKLIALGMSPDMRCHLETMSVNTEWIKRFCINEKNQSDSSDRFNILFLSRIIKEKGVYTFVDASKIFSEKYPDRKIMFHIAGNGDELDNLKDYVDRNKIKNVIFHGDVRGEIKYNLLVNSHLFFFPTEYGEGFPNVIIEALFFGLPVISRPVGAISEIIENGKNGYVDSTNKAIDFIKYIEPLIINKDKLIEMSYECHTAARLKYSSDTVRKKTIEFYQTF